MAQVETMPASQPELKTTQQQTSEEKTSLYSLSQDKLNDVFQAQYPGDLVVLYSDDTVSFALTRLAVVNVTSAPVILRETNKCAGFVEMLDFLAYLIKLAGKKILLSGAPMKWTEEELRRMDELHEHFKETKIEQIMGMSRGGPFCMLNENATFLAAVQAYMQGCRRLALSDKEGNITGVVSQFTIADYIATNLPKTSNEPWLKTKVADFPYKTEEVLAVDPKTSAFDAFAQMYGNRLSAVAILNNKGKIIGNLSASDLKAWHLHERTGLRALVTKPVWLFLKKVRKLQGRRPEFLAAVTPSHRMYDVLQIIHERRVHRVYIVDKDGYPKGVLSLSDLIKGVFDVFRRSEPSLDTSVCVLASH